MVKNPAKLHVYPNWKKRLLKTPDKTFSILMSYVMHGLPPILINNISILVTRHHRNPTKLTWFWFYNLVCVICRHIAWVRAPKIITDRRRITHHLGWDASYPVLTIALENFLIVVLFYCVCLWKLCYFTHYCAAKWPVFWRPICHP